jgi:hypothetical protein
MISSVKCGAPKFDSNAYFSLISTLGMLLNQWVSEAALKPLYWQS